MERQSEDARDFWVEMGLLPVSAENSQSVVIVVVVVAAAAALEFRMKVLL